MSFDNAFIGYNNYYHIFEKKDMKIVQEFNGAKKFAVSRDFKRVAFYTIMPNELHLFDIVQGE